MCFNSLADVAMSVYSKQINYSWAPRGLRGALFMTGSICPCGWRRKRPIPPCALFWFTNAMRMWYTLMGYSYSMPAVNAFLRPSTALPTTTTIWATNWWKWPGAATACTSPMMTLVRPLSFSTVRNTSILEMPRAM